MKSPQRELRHCGSCGAFTVALFTRPSRKLAYGKPTLPPPRFCPCVDGNPDSAAPKLRTPLAPRVLRSVQLSRRYSPPTLMLWLLRMYVAVRGIVSLPYQYLFAFVGPIPNIPPCDEVRPAIRGNPPPVELPLKPSRPAASYSRTLAGEPYGFRLRTNPTPACS